MAVFVQSSHDRRQFFPDAVFPERPSLPELEEVSFRSMAGQQQERVNHALACADANIQLLKCPHDDTKHVLNGVTFTVTAFHEGTNVYVAAETFHKELPGFDNLQAGALASRTFWVEPSGHESSQSMQQLWQKAVDDLSASGAALSEQVPVGDTVAVQAWMRRELQQLVQQSSEALMAQASAEIALRLGKAQA